MLVTGRYHQAQSVTVNLNGNAFAQPVSYQYTFDLADSNAQQYQFLTKVWAKQKIEYLLIQYYSLNPNSSQAQAIKEQIIDLSISYGVITPFTSFTPALGIDFEDEDENPQILNTFELLGNFPNPFNSSTSIRFQINESLNGIVTVKIYNTLGQLVRVLAIYVNGPGLYEVIWDGKLNRREEAPSGTYLYTVDFGDAIMFGKMIMIK
ncbi:FlgD immunoglobulin-like domain containing protein [Calditrichota bacterium]